MQGRTSIAAVAVLVLIAFAHSAEAKAKAGSGVVRNVKFKFGCLLCQTAS
jgi:hypothetical protein